MISEDHVTLKTDAENTDLITEINDSSTAISDSNMFSQYYCVFDQINASLSRDPNILSASVRSM